MLTTRVHIGLSKLCQMLLARRSSTNHFELSHRSAFLHQIFRTLRKVTFGLVARPRKAVYECHPDFSFTFMICKSCKSLLSILRRGRLTWGLEDERIEFFGVYDGLTFIEKGNVGPGTGSWLSSDFLSLILVCFSSYFGRSWNLLVQCGIHNIHQ